MPFENQQVADMHTQLDPRQWNRVGAQHRYSLLCEIYREETEAPVEKPMCDESDLTADQ